MAPSTQIGDASMGPPVAKVHSASGRRCGSEPEKEPSRWGPRKPTTSATVADGAGAMAGEPERAAAGIATSADAARARQETRRVRGEAGVALMGATYASGAPLARATRCHVVWWRIVVLARPSTGARRPRSK